MKNEQKRIIRLLIVATIPMLTSMCINKIPEEAAEFPPGDNPIKISTNILCTQSRVTNNQFEENDAIGFYALTGSQSLNESRYIDNMRFTCTSDGLVPDEEVFYPSGNNKCDFISYYPHQEKAIAPNESSMKVSIETNQSSPAAYSLSDFMTATVAGVSASKKSIKLDFQHKLSQLNIVLQLTENDNIQEVKEEATVFINNTSSEASYDFNADAFTLLNTSQEITPNGEWKVNEVTNKLTGKKVLLFPHQTPLCKISLRINGRTFSSFLPDGLLLESNTSSEVVLHYDSKLGIGKLEANICDWKEGNSKDTTLEEEEEESSFVRIAELNFERTGVFQIINKSSEVIAEVCKEYLLDNQINAQAIVLYPAATKNQGTVLQLVNESGNLHGGSLTWNIDSNSFAYTPGSSAPITTLYVNAEGEIVFAQPADPQTVTTIGSRLNDIRGTETTSYPIIKIGTQYWMGENLNTAKYNNGSEISQIKDMTKITAGYYLKDNNRFYNRTAVIKGTLAPKGWKIPTHAEWEKLKAYIKDTSAVLKSGNQWMSLNGIAKANNKTGFNAEPIGLFNKESITNSSAYSFQGKYVAYWSMENSQTSLAKNSIGIGYDDNAVRISLPNDYSGFSIRCIKE